MSELALAEGDVVRVMSDFSFDLKKGEVRTVVRHRTGYLIVESVVGLGEGWFINAHTVKSLELVHRANINMKSARVMKTKRVHWTSV